MSLEKGAGRYKFFLSDVGLFVTLAFKDKNYTENVIYNKLLSDKLETNMGYVYESIVAQMLIAKGNNLFYYTMPSETWSIWGYIEGRCFVSWMTMAIKGFIREESVISRK